MAKIPEQQQLTPEQAEAELRRWYTLQQELTTARAAEITARHSVAAHYFPEPDEGTNRTAIGGGYELKLDHKINRTVDEAALLAVTGEQVAALELNELMPKLFRWEPQLSVTAYRQLNDKQRDFVDALLDIKPGTPAMSIVPVADRAGQAAHKAAAEAKSGPNVPQFPINTGKEDDTEPGQYFKDTDGVWWLLGGDEWEAVEDAALLKALDAQLKASKPKRGGGRKKKETK